MQHVRTLVDVLHKQAIALDKKKAFVFLTDGETTEQELDYAELFRRACALAAVLQERTRPGDRVILLVAPGIDFIVSIFGCFCAGVIAVPAYPPLNARQLPRLEHIMADAGAEYAISTTDIIMLFSAMTAGTTMSERQINWIHIDQISSHESSLWKAPSLRSEDIAFLQYTSGSTGSPRGVMVSHGNLLSNLHAIQNAAHRTTSDIGVFWLPPYHDMGLIGTILYPLLIGFLSYHMSPMHFLQQPIRWLAALSRYRATSSVAPNFAYDLCVRRLTLLPRDLDIDLSNWNISFNGAEPIHAPTLERFAEALRPYGFDCRTFLPCYGLAEATLIVTATQHWDKPSYRAIASAAGDAREAAPLVSCGRPVPETTLQIVDPESCLPVPPRAEGEIWISGPGVASGYWNNPNETEARFRAKLGGVPGDWLRSGDLGLCIDGELFVTGRLKDLVIVGGKKHHPQDIERTVEECSSLVRPGCCVAFSVYDEDRLTESVILTLELASRHDEPDFQALQRLLVQAVNQHHQLAVDRIAFLPAGTLPKTSSGKKQRRSTREMFLAQTLPCLRSWHRFQKEPEVVGDSNAAT